MKTIERLFLPLSLIKELNRQFNIAGLKVNLAKLLIRFVIADFIVSFISLIIFNDLFQFYKGVNIFKNIN